MAPLKSVIIATPFRAPVCVSDVIRSSSKKPGGDRLTMFNSLRNSDFIFILKYDMEEQA